MKSFLIVLCLFVTVHLATASVTRKFFNGHLTNRRTVAPPDAKPFNSRAVSTLWFEQKVDHFDKTDDASWKQKYFANDEFFNLSDPNTVENPKVFLNVEGEAAASISWMRGGYWYTLAEEHGAMLFSLEHRFYGDSHPFTDLRTENLRYLTSQQALEDLANFIQGMNEKHSFGANVKWVLFGGSYPGSLVAWARQKYPHLVAGGLASSGPLLAKSDFYEYFQVVEDNLRVNSRECADEVEKAFEHLASVAANESEGNITEEFRLCTIFEESTELDKSNFYSALTNTFAYASQYNGRVEVSVDDLCQIFVNTNLTLMERLLDSFETLYGDYDCLDFFYEDSFGSYLDTTITTDGNYRQWYYQTCTEFGWYQTTSLNRTIFGDTVPVELFTKMCEDIFGTSFNATYTDEQTDRTNVHFGGVDIDTTNVVFTHGSMDPWHPMGVFQPTEGLDAPVVYINGTSHCADLYAEKEGDVQSLIDARAVIAENVERWLKVEEEDEESKGVALKSAAFMGVLMVFVQVLL